MKGKGLYKYHVILEPRKPCRLPREKKKPAGQERNSYNLRTVPEPKEGESL